MLLLIGLRERERDRRETLMCKRNIDLLLLACALTRDQTHTSVCALIWNRTYNLFVHGMMLQPTEPPGQGQISLILMCTRLSADLVQMAVLVWRCCKLNL